MSTIPGTNQPQSYNLTGPALAFQAANFPVQAGDTCHRLGGGLATNTISYGLVNPLNPARGIYVQYTGGDLCPPSLTTPRSLRVWLSCDPDTVNVPDKELVEETPGTCLYEMWMKSAYGCPTECPVVQDPATGVKSLCANHGICEYDKTIIAPRCFCNDGFSGVDCSVRATASTGLSAVGSMLIVVCIFLVMTLSFL